MRLVEVLYGPQWYRYLSNELDCERLPVAYLVALYWQRWRIEDAYALVKRLLGLAYFWSGSQNAVELQVWATWLLYAVLVDLTDAVAEALQQPLAAISIEMVYRSLYFFTQAHQRGQADEVVYLAANAKLFGIVKRKRKSIREYNAKVLVTFRVLAQDGYIRRLTARDVPSRASTPYSFALYPRKSAHPSPLELIPALTDAKKS